MSRGLPGYGSLHSALQDGSRPEASTLPRDENLYERILTAAKAIDGLPRHLATHPCGIVVGAHPLTERTALETAPKGLRVTQYDMHGVEDVGLLKIDLLGQRSLSVVADVVHTGGGELNLNGLPPLDPGTYRMINDGRTVGCFQLESPGMRQLLRKLKVDCMETLIASISVIRPGPNDAGMMRHYVDRHNGREKATYLDPRLEPVLRATYGILLYQEDVLKVANVIAGMTLGEADVFRRAMTKLRTPEKMESNHRRFMEGAIAGGTSFEVAAELWRQVSGFAGYAFCKAHSVSYGILAYQSAYLKAHYPARFMTAVINNGGGFYSTAVYVEEARRLGLCILPPDVNLSEADFTAGDCWLRAGLRWIRSLSRETRNRLLQERKKRAFASAEDLFFRVRPLRQEMESLIRCGALDGFGDPRRALLWRLDLMLEERPRPEPEDGLFNEASLSWQSLQPAVRAMPRFHDLSPAERLRWDQETLGFAVSEHPMALLRREGTLRGCIPASQLPRHVGKRVTVAGMIRTAKGTMTKRSERMKFVTIEDETGLLDIVLFPKAYRRWGTVLPGRRALRVTGLVQEDGGGLTLTAEKVEGIDSLPGPAVLTTAEEPEEME
jgi:DNA-directed DNA polymerase III PolC